MKTHKIINTICALSLTFISCAQKKEVVIKTHQITENIYMLEGQGGNIGISLSNDGVFMIDSQFARSTPKILDAIKRLSDKPITYLVNTHHHGDHTGGNENIGQLGATIIAHNNVKKKIAGKTDQKGLPTITFNDKLNIQVNNETVLIFYVENAHTNSDAMLYFTESNVLHTGDTYFNGRYPYIDLKSNGSVNGYINAVKSAMMLIDENTKIIPGHGNHSNFNEYKSFLSMLETIKSKVLKEIADGKTETEVVSNKSLTKTYDDLGYGDHFINSEKMRRTFYKSLKTNH
ncbi:MAG: MBL fold metallo-hydrolase [Algibacter sp.]